MSTDPKKWVAGHVAALPKSGIRDFFELVAKLKGQDVISLGVGEPDFVTPWHIREHAIWALERGRTYYTSNLGLIELRREIARYSRKPAMVAVMKFASVPANIARRPRRARSWRRLGASAPMPPI